MKMNYKIREMHSKDNLAMAEIIRYNLKNHGLDVPGTVYFDPALDNLYECYSGADSRGYYVITDEDDNVVGGIGFDEFGAFDNCAELQKLYLADSAKGNGLGYKLIDFVETKMIEKGYCSSYLETHENLRAAVHIYEKSGYQKIQRPKEVVHGTMNLFYYKKLLNKKTEYSEE